MDIHDTGFVSSCPGCAPNNHPVGVVYYDNGKFWIQDDRYIPVEYPQHNFTTTNTTTLGDKSHDNVR